MSVNKGFFSEEKERMKTRTGRMGAYSVALTLLLLAVLIALNVAVSLLPSSATKLDISAARLFSVSNSTRAVVTSLDQDVTVYWITQEGKEDSVIERLLDVYDEMSDHLKVEKINPDIYPTFADQYTDSQVYNNSLVVECGDKSRYIRIFDIYESESTDYYSSSAATSFDGEGLLTSAINYVTTDEHPVWYVLTGHEETELTEETTSALERENLETQDLNLLSVDQVPEEAAGVIINSPSKDLNDEELTKLRDYVKGGGHLMVFSGVKKEGSLPKLNSLLEDYNIEVVDGIVVEGDRSHYASTSPFILLPDMSSNSIVGDIADNNKFVIMPIAQGLKVGENPEHTVTYQLLTTSDAAFSKKAGLDIKTYEKEEGDTDGPFALAVTVQVSDTDGKIVWAGSDFLTDDTYNSYSAGANMDFVINSLKWMTGDTDTLSISSKSLESNYLTMNAFQGTMMKIILIGFIPLAYLLCGVDEVLKRRKKA